MIGLILFQTLNAADFAVTWQALKLGAVEQNPLIGKHPSGKRLLAVWAAFSLAHIGVALLFPPEYLFLWVWIPTIGKGLLVVKNIMVYRGLKGE